METTQKHSNTMKPYRRFSSFTSTKKTTSSSSSTTTTTIIYTYKNEHSNPPEQQQPTPLDQSLATTSATRIQSAYRAHAIRTLYRKISSVSSEADRLQRQIQRQETVDAMRRDEKVRMMMNEALMSLLLRLDSVPGIHPTVREARRKVSRRIVGLQEITDAICGAKLENEYGDCGESLWWSWRVCEEMEEEICRESGGDEMEKFCAQYLGFRCLHRFLRE